MKIIFRNSVALLLVFTMIFSLGISVLALDEDMTDEKVEFSLEEDIDEPVNTEGQEVPDEEDPQEEDTVPEEDLDQEDEVDLYPEAVVEPEPEQKQEQAKEEPQKKEQPKKDGERIDKAEDGVGAMLDGFPATPHPGNPTPIIEYAPGSLGPFLTSQLGFRTMSNGDELAPGEVRTSKTATPVKGMVNTWDIKVRIEGRDDNKVETTDVVLVIDRSGSMADNNRMENAKTAANNFINTMIPNDPSLRIAIVSYSSNYQGAQLVTVNHQFSRDTITLESAVNGLSALGGTHTQAGIIQGRSLFIGSNADNKYMVLLSDGEPTYSYEPHNWTNGRPSWGTHGNIINNNQRTGVYDGNFNTGTIVGTGSDLRQSYNYSTGVFQPTYRRHIHNGDAAIKAGVDARVGIDGLFTIAVEAGNSGTNILKDIASPGWAYSTDNPEDLQEIYDRIGVEIATQSAIRDAVVVDEMGDGFSLIESTLSTSQGSTSVVAAGGGKNQTITWNLGQSVTNLVEGTTDVRYAEMTYRVEINDNILGIQGAKIEEHKLFETNKSTNLKYTDTNDVIQNELIDSPEVDPVLLKIKKILLDDDAGNRKFNVNINKSVPNGFSHDESLVPNEEYVWLTTLRYKGNYAVTETGITGPGIIDLNEYEITYEIDGEEISNFLVYHDTEVDIHENPIPRGDVDIIVTNKLIPQTVDVRIEKEVTGNLGDMQGDFSFTVQVEGEEGPRTFNLEHGKYEILNNIPKNATLTLREETRGHDVTVMVGQQVIEPNDDKYTIQLDGEGITIKVTNHKNELIDTGITFDSLPYILILVLSTVGLGVGFVRKRNIGKED